MARKVNPENLSWTAPLTNTDGSLIDYALAYELGVGPVGGPYVATASFPGTLNPNGMYEAPLPALALDDDVPYGLVLNAFNTLAPDLKSDWSNEVEIIFTGKLPNVPTGLEAL